MGMRMGLIPAAGTASRMRGLPKFLLPVSDNVQTLVEHHVELMANFVERIVIPTRPENYELLERLELPDYVEIKAITTSTMSETVVEVLDQEDFETCILGMPDTYYASRNPYEILSREPQLDINLALWATKPSQRGQVGSVELDLNNRVVRCEDKSLEWNFGQHWGALRFNSSALNLLDPRTPHVGFIINPALEAGLLVGGQLMEGEYFDCGTFAEYKRCVGFI